MRQPAKQETCGIFWINVSFQANTAGRDPSRRGAWHMPARQIIARALQSFLRQTRIRKVHFAQATVAPPVLAYVTNFPRLSVPLSGKHPMEIAQNSKTMRVPLVRGDVLFAGRNCWNRPDWST